MSFRERVDDPSEEASIKHASEVSRVIAGALKEAGKLLFVSGAVIGRDRVEGRSRWGYGDDRVVGLAVASEIAGDLGTAAVDLLEAGHRYAGMALLRQIVEVEYLVWAFAHADEEARHWLNADDEQLWALFRPAELRRRSGGRFRAREYKSHCALGGHPSPKARALLEDHSSTVPVAWLWTDLAMHLTRLWPSLIKASAQVGISSQLFARIEESVAAI